ncbi:MAG: hypothetical protein DI585_01615 [Pseudomonas fluorescens]|nr:MAG: hypothetical protein DI585_01615 [Pseudomonas fluorescens]
MRNSLVLLAVVLSVAAFAGMMRVKTDVQTMDRERLRLVRERAELRETKRVLEAEWALLASPERLERLVRGKGYVAANALDVVPFAVSSTVAVSAVVPVVSMTAPSPAAIVEEAPVSEAIVDDNDHSEAAAILGVSLPETAMPAAVSATQP